MTTLIILSTKSLDNYEWLNFCVTRHDFVFIVKVSRMKLACKIDFAASAAQQSGTKLQKSAKNWIKKFVKLTGRTYACSSLANLEYEHMKLPETEIMRICCNLLGKIRELSHGLLNRWTDIFILSRPY
jgi:hypothetical protein